MIMDSSEYHHHNNGKAQVLVSYHNIQRQLYARLAGNLRFDVQVSMKILAFWNWLESCGYSNVVHRLLQLDDSGLYMLTNHAISCLYFLITGTELNPYASIESQTRYMTTLLGAPFSHWFLYANKEIAVVEIVELFGNVCSRAFHDIALLAPGLDGFGPGLERNLWDTIVGPRIWGLDSWSSSSFSFLDQLSSMKERTLYVNFLVTDPISEDELLHFLFGKYGIRPVKKVEVNHRFARVVLESKETVWKIFEGKSAVQLSINGKQGLAKRFVTMKEAIDTHHLWPPLPITSNPNTSSQVLCFFNPPPRIPPLDLSFIFKPNPKGFFTLF